MTDVRQAMAIGTRRYADALAVLEQFGPAVFTQTGGMCAALELTLERGNILVTDEDDSLPWERSELRGWGVGFYASDDASEGPEAFVSKADTDPHALVGLVKECLREAATVRFRR